jgi:type I site-specific restriction-modification system R (restriction) subunit
VGHAEHSGDLRRFIEGDKKIVITTVQKFPFILDDIGSQHRNRYFAIIIDEAHSSQGGKASSAVSMALSAAGAEEEDETVEDMINRMMEAHKLLANASYFAFTATPKNKTLEIFGEAFSEDGQVKHRPFHTYTMKQAIDEGFILDVLRSYTPIDSYYRLVKTVEADPEFDTKRAQKKLRRYVESYDHAHGAAPGDPGLRTAATAADASDDDGRRGADIRSRERRRFVAAVDPVILPSGAMLRRSSRLPVEETTRFGWLTLSCVPPHQSHDGNRRAPGDADLAA